MRQFYPNTETHVGAGPGGDFYMADIERILPEIMNKYSEKAQCAYIDPPFLTGKDFEMRMRVGEADWKGQTASLKIPAYSDKYDRSEYMRLMRAVITAARELLSPSGSFFLHCVQHMCAELWVLTNEIFGSANFLNEIVWPYQTGGRSTKHFSRKHDNILFFRKSASHFFDGAAVSRPRADSRSNHMRRHVDADGRAYSSIRSGGKIYTYYDDEPVPPSDVWDDVSHMQQKDPDRTGYDNQKPSQLMERIIKCSAREGQLVADLFSGSGTTLMCANRLGNAFLGVDKSVCATHLTLRRLSGANATFHGVAGSHTASASARLIQGIADYAFELSSFDPMTEDAFPGLDAVDSWAAGYMQGDEFTAYAYEERSAKKPALSGEIRFPVRMGAPAIRISDVYARQSYFALDE